VLFTHVVGARPNFMKAAPVLSAFSRRGWQQTLVHTGQHYDDLMSDVLFRQLDLPAPDINLGVGSGSHAQQSAAVLVAVERVLLERRPDVVVVYGDVNSTMAATLAAAKLEVPVAHIEAGVRSFDRSMPEEVNRIVTDRLASYLFTPSEGGKTNLVREGVEATAIFSVGNVMIDTLKRCLPLADASSVLNKLGLRAGDPFILTTLHRPGNVDDAVRLAAFVDVLREIARRIPVIFPVHPRTRSRIADRGTTSALHLLEPIGYFEFLGLQRLARLVVTDSGGVQA
jgi:UDP-N-acetylglucosamine 2-epimerase (non-hydrolysing)